MKTKLHGPVPPRPRPGPRPGALRRQAGAAGARRAEGLLASPRQDLHARQRPDRHARPLRHRAEGHGAARDPDRQRQRGRRTRSGSPTWSATCSRRAPRPAAPRRSPRTRRGWAARSTSPSPRTGPRSAATCCRSSGPRWSRSSRTSRATRRSPRRSSSRRKADRLRQLSIARSQPQPLAQEKFRAVLYGDSPYGRLFPTEAMLQAYTLAQVRGFLREELRRGARAPLRRRPLRRAGHGGRDPQGLRRLEAAAPAPSLTVPAPKSERAVYLVDRPGAVQSTINLGMPVIDPSNPDWDRSVRDERAARRLLLLAHHVQHPRAEGLHVLADGQLSSRYRDAYWAEIADVTTNVTGPADQGDPRRDRPAAGRAAVRQGAQGIPELPRRRLHPAELIAARDHRSARVRRSPRPPRGLPERVRQARLRHHAARGSGDGEEVPPGRQDHDRGRRRPEDRRGAGQAGRGARRPVIRGTRPGPLRGGPSSLAPQERPRRSSRPFFATRA